MSTDGLTGGAALIAALESLPPAWPTESATNQLSALLNGSGGYTLGDVIRLNLDQTLKNLLVAPGRAMHIGDGLWHKLEDMPASPLGDPDTLPDGW
jgi:hypothetical protein